MMTRYRIAAEDSVVAIELMEIDGPQDELLQAFGECQEGRCSCPTNEFDKVAAMEVAPTEDSISIRLRAKPGMEFDADEIAACFDHTIARTSG